MNRNVALMLVGGMIGAATFGYVDPIDGFLVRSLALFCVVYGYNRANEPR